MGTPIVLEIICDGKCYKFYFQYDGYIDGVPLKVLLNLKKILNDEKKLKFLKNSLKKSIVINEQKLKRNKNLLIEFGKFFLIEKFSLNKYVSDINSIIENKILNNEIFTEKELYDNIG